MVSAASILLPLVMAAVLLASGVAKVLRPDDLAGWEALGVPAAVRRGWLVRVHPWGEIALGIALIALGGVLGALAGIVSVVLMGAYLWLVVRAIREAPDASCFCFGMRRRVTRLTVARNVWLTGVALAALAVIWTTPTWGGALAAAWRSDAGIWVGMTGIAVVTALVIVWPDPTSADVASHSGNGSPVVDGEEVDYVRVRTPAVPVTLASGTIVSLRDLASQRPLLLLAVSPTCGSCLPVIDNAATWRRLLPELDVRLLVRSSPVPGSFMEIHEPQSLHDPEGFVSASIADWSTPTAVLLGADGLLAGGPVTGADAITEFVADIRASLDEAAAAVTSP